MGINKGARFRARLTQKGLFTIRSEFLLLNGRVRLPLVRGIGKHQIQIVETTILRRMFVQHVLRTLIERRTSCRTRFNQTAIGTRGTITVMHFVHVKIEKKITREYRWTLRTDMLMVNVMMKIKIVLTCSTERTERTAEKRIRRRTINRGIFGTKAFRWSTTSDLHPWKREEMHNNQHLELDRWIKSNDYEDLCTDCSIDQQPIFTRYFPTWTRLERSNSSSCPETETTIGYFLLRYLIEGSTGPVLLFHDNLSLYCIARNPTLFYPCRTMICLFYWDNNRQSLEERF